MKPFVLVLTLLASTALADVQFCVLNEHLVLLSPRQEARCRKQAGRVCQRFCRGATVPNINLCRACTAPFGPCGPPIPTPEECCAAGHPIPNFCPVCFDPPHPGTPLCHHPPRSSGPASARSAARRSTVCRVHRCHDHPYRVAHAPPARTRPSHGASMNLALLALTLLAGCLSPYDRCAGLCRLKAAQCVATCADTVACARLHLMCTDACPSRPATGCAL
jgi:hypothetical protein